MKCKSYESPYYAVFSSLPPLPHILLSTLFLNTHNLCSSLSSRDQFSQPYKTRGKLYCAEFMITVTTRRTFNCVTLLWFLTDTEVSYTLYVSISLSWHQQRHYVQGCHCYGVVRIAERKLAHELTRTKHAWMVLDRIPGLFAVATHETATQVFHLPRFATFIFTDFVFCKFAGSVCRFIVFRGFSQSFLRVLTLFHDK